jgi:hypothetical protein
VTKNNLDRQVVGVFLRDEITLVTKKCFLLSNDGGMGNKTSLQFNFKHKYRIAEEL